MASNQPAADQVRIVVAGTTFGLWKQVDIDSDVMTPADAFQVSAAAPDKQAIALIREGAPCDVYVGDDRQMAGVIDDVTLSSRREADTLEVSGRDNGAYLVDCESDAIRAKHLTLLTLAQKLLKPSWGIKNVIVSNESNRKLLLGKKDRGTRAGRSSSGSSVWVDAARPLQQNNQAEKVARILDERTRQLGVTWWLTAEGDLFIGKPNYNQEVAFQFLCFDKGSARARYNNCEIEMKRSMGDRYSELVVVGQGTSSSSVTLDPQTKTTAKGAKFKASAKDPDLVARGIERRTVIHDGDTISRKQAQARADVEMSKKRMSGLSLHVTVPSFRQNDRLFTIDTLASVQWERAGVAAVYWISQRRFIESRERRRCEMTLYPKGVYLP